MLRDLSVLLRSSFYVPVLLFFFFVFTVFLWTYDFDVHASRFPIVSTVTTDVNGFCSNRWGHGRIGSGQEFSFYGTDANSNSANNKLLVQLLQQRL